MLYSQISKNFVFHSAKVQELTGLLMVNEKKL